MIYCVGVQKCALIEAICDKFKTGSTEFLGLTCYPTTVLPLHHHHTLPVLLAVVHDVHDILHNGPCRSQEDLLQCVPLPLS